MPKASDFSKRLKAIHLGGQPCELTIGQVGVERQQKRGKQDVTIFASEGMDPQEAQMENVVYLWFRELGVTRNMRLNETNLTTLIEARGDDFKAWINCKVTLTPDDIFAFGKKQKTIVITGVKAPAVKSAQKVNKDTGEITRMDTSSAQPITRSAPPDLPDDVKASIHAATATHVNVPSAQGNGENGRLYSSESLFDLAKQHGMTKEAQKIANAHAKDQDWKAAETELLALLPA